MRHGLTLGLAAAALLAHQPIGRPARRYDDVQPFDREATDREVEEQFDRRERQRALDAARAEERIAAAKAKRARKNAKRLAHRQT